MATSQPHKSSKLTKPHNPTSHLATIELKQRIITSLSKLSDRDTHQIAVEDLEKIIQNITNDTVSVLLNSLYDAGNNDPKPAVKKESIRLLSVFCTFHFGPALTHLTKIIAHIVKKLKDSDSGVRDACRDAIGSLASLFLKGDGESLGLFVKPLFEAMNENSKTVQSGAALCMAKMVESCVDPSAVGVQKLCPRICKFLKNQNFMANASLLPVVSSLSQVGAIGPQHLETLLQTIHECLSNSDWATRKAAADTLSCLALHSKNLVAERATSTITVLEASRFDKIKPVRDSMLEALQLWKTIAGKGDDDQEASCHGAESSESAGSSEKKDLKDGSGRNKIVVKDSSNGTLSTDSTSKTKGSNISDKAVGLLKKKALALSVKELNPEFFQKLEARGSGDLPVEVVVPRRFNASSAQNEEVSQRSNAETGERTSKSQLDTGYSNLDTGTSKTSSREQDVVDRRDLNQRESSSSHGGFSDNGGQPEGFMSSKENWVAIQRQLLLLEKQQAHLMNMLQDFMGGSHGSMMTLENRVRGLERVVEDMARDLSLSSGRRGGSFMERFDECPNKRLGKSNGVPDYSSTKLGRGCEGRITIAERFVPPDGISSSTRARAWRPDAPGGWDLHAYGKAGQAGFKRGIGGGLMDPRFSKREMESDQVGSRRAWDNGAGPVRFGEGPSARSVWQASKDEATLEAIRGTVRGAKVAIPELAAEALTDDNIMQEHDPVWTSWTNAMDALSVGDVQSAFAEVLSTGDELLLVKLMDRSGPVIDHLSHEVASEILHAVAQFLLEPNLLDICLSWVQQLIDILVENGSDALGIPMQVKKEMLLNLTEISSMDLPEDWEGATPELVLLPLASAWEIDLQELEK